MSRYDNWGDVMGTYFDHSRGPFRDGGAPSRVTECRDQHGAALHELALMVMSDERLADRAVALALDAALDWTGPTAPLEPDRRYLARMTYLACTQLVSPDRAGVEAQRSALRGLTRLGDHSLAEAALLVHLDPRDAADLIGDPSLRA